MEESNASTIEQPKQKQSPQQNMEKEKHKTTKEHTYYVPQSKLPFHLIMHTT